MHVYMHTHREKMTKRISCNVLSLFEIMLCIQVVSSQLSPDQVRAMTKIYEIIQNNTDSSSFVWSNVMKTSNPCSWKGVGCTSDNSSINTISLMSSSISTSEFLPFVCNIPTLESLDVYSNQLTSIPDGFFSGCGGINGLKLLNFSVNKLIGPFPSFNGFPTLEYLDFSRNMLSGEIHLQLDGLGSLKSLNLGWNSFRGKIPTNLGKMNHLEEIVLSTNSFTGEIPLEITKLKNLSLIDLGGNRLSGSFPIEFGGFIRLKTLILSLNILSGGIPTFLANITSLERFAANQNSFTGSIPSGVTRFLSFLDLSYNNLSGTLPSDLLSGTNLQAVDLSFNKLEGHIPSITSTKLYRLRLSSNSLNGTIPSAELGSLMYLELDNNMLSGEIPSDLGMSLNLSLLNLANNRLRGTLPPSLFNLTRLQVLSLQSNRLSGGIPPQISQLSILLKLNISSNSLNGSIPLSISRMQKLRNLDLHGNNLSGSIPDSIGDIPYLVELQLGDNLLSGQIPQMPVTLQISLNLSQNLFDGPIPLTLETLQNLEVLDLSNNKFSGVIPNFLAQIRSLTHVLIMNNDLSGVVPKFRDNLVFDAKGNELLAFPAEYPISEISQRKRKPLIEPEVGIAYASGFPVGLFISVISIFISRMHRSINGTLPAPNSIHTPNVDFKKAMEAASDHFNITFKTTFSTFYKAVMPSGTTYLVKKIKHTNKIVRFPQHKQLVEELELFGSLSNPNVMIPVAYVLTLRRAYIFYGFVRGTLYDILHHRTGNKLDWPSRYNIAVGISKGLAYLHECTFGPIILLDLCSKSILLKSLDEPQISDIELCNLIPPSSSECKYGSATAAGNVYSFGVVLLELVTGKPAVGEGDELVTWVLSVSEWDQILDSNVSEASNGVRRQMAAVVEVALACVSVSPEMRPNAVTVVQMLLNARQSDALAED